MTAVQSGTVATVQDSGTAPVPEVGRTILEGIRGKVFSDRYALKNERGEPIEHTPEEMWARVARGIAAVEATPEKQQYWEGMKQRRRKKQRSSKPRSSHEGSALQSGSEAG